MTFTYVTVTHTFEDADDTPAAGYVEFTPVAAMRNTITVVAAPVKATLTTAGVMSQKLAANTDPGTTPAGTTYQVVERFTGQKAFTYFVQVPHDQGPTLDLRTLGGWQGATESGGTGTVNSVNGITPDTDGDVTLAAGDVGAQLADGDLTGLAGLGDGVPRRASGTWGLVSGTPDGTKFLRDDGTWAAASGSSYTSENARDDIAAALVAGSNMTITVNDAGDTITLAAATSGSSGIPASTVDAKGDLIVGTANDTVARRSVGTDGQALLADSAQATGVSWGAPAPASHSHAATDVTSGTVATARLGSGTANSSSYLRGDQTWTTPGIAAVTGLQTALDAKAPLASPTFTGTVTVPKVVSTPVAVTYAATTTIDATLGSRFKITATGDLTLAAPSNPADGQQITVVILASGAGRALTISGSILLTTGLSASVAITSGKRQILGLVYDGDIPGWLLVASTQQA